MRVILVSKLLLEKIGTDTIFLLVPKLRLGTHLLTKLCFANEINVLVRKRH